MSAIWPIAATTRQVQSVESTAFRFSSYSCCVMSPSLRSCSSSRRRFARVLSAAGGLADLERHEFSRGDSNFFIGNNPRVLL